MSKLRELDAAHRKELSELKSRFDRELDEARRAGGAEVRRIEREAWCSELDRLSWPGEAPEVEVEAKVVYPMLRYLGYSNREISMRVPIRLAQGSQDTVLWADWVARDEEGNPLVVVEAKAPRMEADESARKQAQSYAFHLGAPVYITTNGRQMKVYQRGVLNDVCKVDCAVRELGAHWEAVEQVASKASVVPLRKGLLGQ